MTGYNWNIQSAEQDKHSLHRHKKHNKSVISDCIQIHKIIKHTRMLSLINMFSYLDITFSATYSILSSYTKSAYCKEVSLAPI